MLGKLIKHDMRYLSRTILPLVVAIIGIGVLAGALMGLSIHSFTDIVGTTANPASTPLAIIGMTISMLIAAFGIGGAAVAVMVIIVGRFYTNLFTDEAYLSFTLPVTGTDHLVSKGISGYIWALIAAVAEIIALLLFMGIMLLIVDIPAEFAGAISGAELPQEFGSIISSTLPILIIYCLIAPMSGLMFMYTCIAAGHRISNKHPILVAVALYIGIMTVIQSITGVASMLVTVAQAYDVVIDIDDGLVLSASATLINIEMLIALLINVILLVAGFLVTRHLLTKKLNVV
ncbi:MAG: hypothetical protein Q4B99_06605 [Clostridia bacterium]|nr:hypothetical protein [Clostridia bacterium]